MIRIVPQKSVGMFRALNRVIWGLCFNFYCSSGPRTQKVVKTRPKHFSTVLTRNDKNCTPKSVGMFWVQNRVFRAQFSTFPATVVPGPAKVAKIRPKHFSTLLIENDIHYTTNYVGMFLV